MEPKDGIRFAEESSLTVTSGPKGNKDEQILNRIAANWTARAGRWFSKKKAIKAPAAPANPDNGDSGK